MESTGKTIARNASYLIMSQFFTWGLSLFVMVILPRYLGASVTGKYYTAVAIWNIMAMFIAFGMDVLLAKEIAKDPDDISEYYGNSFFSRTVLFFVSLIIVTIYAEVLQLTSEIVGMLFIFGLSTLVWQYSSISQSVLQGTEKMGYISLANVTSKFFNTFITILFVFLGLNIFWIASVGIIVGLISFGIQSYYVRKIFNPQIKFNIGQSWEMLKDGFPLLLAGAAIVIYLEVDIIIISWLVNEETVGWYGSADILYGTLLFVPTVIMTAVFPAMARENVKDKEALKELVRRSFNVLLLVGVPIGFGIFLIADSAVVLIYGSDFAGSGPVLAIKGLVLTMTYQNMIIGSALMSMDRQNPWTVVMTIGTIAVVPLDLIFIPWALDAFNNGAVGASFVFIITEMFMMICGIYLLPKGTFDRATTTVSLKVVFSGLAMIGATWWFREMFIAIPMIIGAVSYIAAILILNTLTDEDWEIIRNGWNSIKGRIFKSRVNAA